MRRESVAQSAAAARRCPPHARAPDRDALLILRVIAHRFVHGAHAAASDESRDMAPSARRSCLRHVITRRIAREAERVLARRIAHQSRGASRDHLAQTRDNFRRCVPLASGPAVLLIDRQISQCEPDGLGVWTTQWRRWRGLRCSGVRASPLHARDTSLNSPSVAHRCGATRHRPFARHSGCRDRQKPAISSSESPTKNLSSTIFTCRARRPG
jgi:hypothetical protein